MSAEPDWVECDAVVEVMPWGRNDYLVLRVDEKLAAAARAARTRRVEGTIDGVDVNVGVNRADVIPDAFVYAGKALLRRLGAAAGDLVHCRLRPADPDDVPIAEDVERALTEAGLLDAFHRRTPAQRRRLVQPVEDAVRAHTRQQRITALVKALSAG